MAVKAIGLIQGVEWSSATQFKVSIRWVYFDSSGSQGDLIVDGLTTGISQLTMEATIKDALRDYLSITGLDTVRLIGATI